MVALSISRVLISAFAALGVVLISGTTTYISAEGSPRPAVDDQFPRLFDPRPLAETPPSAERAHVEPVVTLPAQTTVATSPPDVEPLTNVPVATTPPVMAEPIADKQLAATATPRAAPPAVQDEKPINRARGTVGHQARNETQRVRSQKLRRVKTASSRRHRVTRLSARGVRGISASMNATRYRVGGALKCFVRFNCTPRRVAGTAIGAAAGAAVGRGGGAVAGALIGAVVAGR
jgi:hypothetical protein